MGNSLTEARKRIKQLEVELKATNGVSSIYYVERALSHAFKKREKSDEGYVTTHSVKPGSKRSRPPNQSKEVSGANASTSRNATGKPKNKLSPVLEGEIDEVSETPIPPRAASGQRSKERKPKKTSKNDKGKAKAVSVESETDEEPGQRRAPKGKRQRKISSDDDDDDEVEVEPHPVKKAKERTKGDVVGTKVKGRRGTRQTDGEATNRNSTDATANDVDSETEQAPAKKKRKININIFPKPAEPTFAFMVSAVA